jgi:hypothetical protein
MYGKEKLIIQEIINKLHPKFTGNPELCNFALESPELFNVERLVEVTMAHVGGYDYVDGAHYDFSDGSECKTASVRPTPSKPNSSSYALEISNVISGAGTAKSGSIRVVLYNPHIQQLRYYYLPPGEIDKIGVNIHPTSNKGRVFATWNIITDTCNKLDRYSVPSFEDLAKK